MKTANDPEDRAVEPGTGGNGGRGKKPRSLRGAKALVDVDAPRADAGSDAETEAEPERPSGGEDSSELERMLAEAVTARASSPAAAVPTVPTVPTTATTATATPAAGARELRPADVLARLGLQMGSAARRGGGKKTPGVGERTPGETPSGVRGAPKRTAMSLLGL